MPAGAARSPRSLLMHWNEWLRSMAREGCYEVGSEVIEAFKERFPDCNQLFTPTREGHARVDLLKANRNQLLSMGVNEERIHTTPLCTMCRTDLFFSYRREKSVHGKVGRLMAVIGRQSAQGQ